MKSRPINTNFFDELEFFCIQYSLYKNINNCRNDNLMTNLILLSQSNIKYTYNMMKKNYK